MKLTPYQQHVINNPYIFMSPCADKFYCSHRDDDKGYCSRGCTNLKLYHQVLDFYGQANLGGLSLGHIYQSAVPVEDELQLSFPQTRGNKKPMLEEY